ncbi:MAG: hypothetical protein AAF495_21190 [Pseudomonadota bacterium]
MAALLRTLVLSGQLERPARRREPWLRAGERPNDRLVLGIIHATSQAAPRRGTKRSRLV